MLLVSVDLTKAVRATNRRIETDLAKVVWAKAVCRRCNVAAVASALRDLSFY